MTIVLEAFGGLLRSNPIEVSNGSYREYKVQFIDRKVVWTDLASATVDFVPLPTRQVTFVRTARTHGCAHPAVVFELATAHSDAATR